MTPAGVDGQHINPSHTTPQNEPVVSRVFVNSSSIMLLNVVKCCSLTREWKVVKRGLKSEQLLLQIFPINDVLKFKIIFT